MSDSIKHSALFIELDALLDTRLAVVYGFGETFAKRAIDGGYYGRIIDEFPGLPFETFQERYQNRDRSVLRNTVVTKMASFIHDFVMNTLVQTATTPFHMQPKIIVNSYPYVLQADEETNIINAVIALTNGKADVELVQMPIETITPKYVKQHVTVMVMYEYYKWMEVHSENGNLKAVTCPEVTMIGPSIFFKKPERKAIEECKELGITPFKAMEKVAAPLISLQLIAIDHFSLAMKLTPTAQNA